MTRLSSALSEPSESAARDGRMPLKVRETLFKRRTVLVFGEIDAQLSETVSAQLLALAEEGDEPIRIFIHSPGGHVESADTLFDVIRFISPDVQMIGTGWVASAGALIYAAAKQENRYAFPNTRFLLHQPSGGMSGRASEIEVEAAQIVAMRERLHRTFALATGKSVEQVARDTERNLWMTAREAEAYGLVHRIIESADDLGRF